MKRYVYFNPNPVAARVGDCAVRAVSKALEQSWEKTFIGLALQGFCVGDMPSANHVWGSYLQQHGFKRYVINCDGCINVDQFSSEHNKGIYVLGLSGHTVCVKDGQYYDSWDSGAEPISYYWKKE